MFKKKEKQNKEENKEIEEKSTEREIKEELKEKLSLGFLRCHLIFEVVGKPAEFIDETIKKLLEQLEKEEKIEILKKQLGKAREYEANGQKTDLFSTFAEVEILIENLKRLTQIIFDYMPSSIEIFEPEEIKLKVQDCNLFVNELASKLHEYDISNKKLVFERNILAQKLQEIKIKEKSGEEKQTS